MDEVRRLDRGYPQKKTASMQLLWLCLFKAWTRYRNINKSTTESCSLFTLLWSTASLVGSERRAVAFFIPRLVSMHAPRSPSPTQQPSTPYPPPLLLDVGSDSFGGRGGLRSLTLSAHVMLASAVPTAREPPLSSGSLLPFPSLPLPVSVCPRREGKKFR